MNKFDKYDSKQDDDLIMGWRAGIAEGLTMIYQTMATKMSQAGAKGNLTKDDALRMPPPQTARDYYYEARGLLNAFHFMCSQRKINLKISPEQAVEYFWNARMTMGEIEGFIKLCLEQMERQNIIPEELL